MSVPSKVIVLDPDARAGRQVQLGFAREGIEAVAPTLPADPAQLTLAAEGVGLVMVGASNGTGVQLVKRARELLAAANADIPILVTGRGVQRGELEAAGADEVVEGPVFLRDVVTLGRILRGTPAEQRGHFVGSLAETTGVYTLVRAISALGRSSVLTLIRGLRRGEVRFYRGEVTSAQVGLIHGQAALHQLLLWTDARFDLGYEDVVRRQQIPLTPDELFADAERFLEGVRDSAGSLSPATVLEPDVQRVQDLGKQIPTEVHGVLRMFDGHRVLADILEDSPYRVFETLRVAQKAVEAGLLKHVDAQRPKATWKAVLAIEEWLVGSETREAVVARTSAIDSQPLPSKKKGKGASKRRSKKPSDDPATERQTGIDWGALVPRTIGAEVGPLAQVVPALATHGEVELKSRDVQREKLESLMDTDKRDKIFPTEIGLEPKIIVDEQTPDPHDDVSEEPETKASLARKPRRKRDDDTPPAPLPATEPGRARGKRRTPPAGVVALADTPAAGVPIQGAAEPPTSPAKRSRRTPPAGVPVVADGATAESKPKRSRRTPPAGLPAIPAPKPATIPPPVGDAAQRATIPALAKVAELAQAGEQAHAEAIAASARVTIPQLDKAAELAAAEAAVAVAAAAAASGAAAEEAKLEAERDRVAAEARAKAEADAAERAATEARTRAKAEAEAAAHAAADAEAAARAAAKAKADAEAAAKAAADAQAAAEAEAEEDTRMWARAKADAEAKAADEVRAKVEADAKAKAEAEAKAAEEARIKAEAEAKAEADAAAKAADEARAQAEAEAKAKADAEAAEEARIRAEADAKAKADAAAEEARIKAEADAKAAEEARIRAEADAKAKAEADAKAAEEARIKAEADARAADEARIKAEARAKIDADARESARGAADDAKAYAARVKAAAEAKRLEAERNAAAPATDAAGAPSAPEPPKRPSLDAEGLVKQLVSEAIPPTIGARKTPPAGIPPVVIAATPTPSPDTTPVALVESPDTTPTPLISPAEIASAAVTAPVTTATDDSATTPFIRPDLDDVREHVGDPITLSEQPTATVKVSDVVTVTTSEDTASITASPRVVVTESAIVQAGHATPALAAPAASTSGPTPTPTEDEPSDGIIRSISGETESDRAARLRQVLPPNPPAHDGPEIKETTGEIKPVPKAPETKAPDTSEPSILVSELAAIHAAASAVSAHKPTTPTPDAASSSKELEVASVRRDAATFTDEDEAFFKRAESHTHTVPKVESFDDLDEGYVPPPTFWERVFGKKKKPTK